MQPNDYVSDCMQESESPTDESVMGLVQDMPCTSCRWLLGLQQTPLLSLSHCANGKLAKT